MRDDSLTCQQRLARLGCRACRALADFGQRRDGLPQRWEGLERGVNDVFPHLCISVPLCGTRPLLKGDGLLTEMGRFGEHTP